MPEWARFEMSGAMVLRRSFVFVLVLHSCLVGCEESRSGRGPRGLAGAAGAAGATAEEPAPPERCGDGRPGALEACDDGNMEDEDGCSPSCSVEPGYVCLPSGACEPSRGDAACTATPCRLGAVCLELVALAEPGLDQVGFSCACPDDAPPECPSSLRAIVLPLPVDMSRCYGAAISGDGSTVVGTCESFSPPDETRWSDGAFKWTIAGGVERLPDGEGAQATAVNGDGSVSVGATYDFGAAGEIDRGAIIWRPSGSERFAAGLAGAKGVSADGRVVVGGDVTGWVWNGAEPVVLAPTTPGLETAALAISADGTRIIGYEIEPYLESNPLTWTADGAVERIPLPPGAHGMPFGVSADGSIVLARESGTYDGCCGGGYFRWPSESGDRLDYDGRPVAMSADGNTILGSTSPGITLLDLALGQYEPVLAGDPGGPLLDLAPVGLSANGRFILANARLASPRDDRTRPILIWRP